MNRKWNLGLALAGGFFGGFLSRYIQPLPVQAQTQTPAPKEVQAQSFVLVNDKNETIGTFKTSFNEPGQTPTVVFVDRNGREIWRAGVSLRKVTER
jgi:hypothetical protein